MVTFPARKIIDVRVYDRAKGAPETILYHNKDYSIELSATYIEQFNVKFNLYDEERKKYISIEKNFDEIRSKLYDTSIKIIRLETVADSKVIPNYDYNNIWENL